MQHSTNQTDTAPFSSMLPNPNEGFGGAGAGASCECFVAYTLAARDAGNPQNTASLIATRYQGVSPGNARVSALNFSEDSQFPTSAWASFGSESSTAASSAELYHGTDIAVNNPLIEYQNSGLSSQNHFAACNYAAQTPVLVYDVQNDVQNSRFQGNNNYGFAQYQQGYGNGHVDYSTGFQAQPGLFNNQALTTGFDHHVNSQDARAITSGFNVNPGSSTESPAFHDPGSFGPVYANQTFSDAAFANSNIAGSMHYDPTTSSLAFSNPTYTIQAFSSPAFPAAGSASMFSDQNLSTNQYAAYQDMQLPAPGPRRELAVDDSVLPTATPAQTMQTILPATGQHQSFQCRQSNCLATFTRDADRIRHEGTAHFGNQGQHLCPIHGCVKAQGRGYSRADKVTEHLWKKHGDLGYVKRV